MIEIKREILETALGHLSGGDSLQIIGPLDSGKSTLLKQIEKKIKETMEPEGPESFHGVKIWHLGHTDLKSDKEFIKELCSQIAGTLDKLDKDYGEIVRESRDHYDTLLEIFDLLEGDNKRILMLWDGFDRPLVENQLPVNLWNQMRTLASRNSLSIITATRKPLSELMQGDTYTSPFWNIFRPEPIPINPFSDQERRAYCEEYPDLTFAAHAKQKIAEWTGCSPRLFNMLLTKLGEGENPNITPALVDEVAMKMIETQTITGFLRQQWEACDEDTREAFREVIHSNIPVREKSLTVDLLRKLKVRGFVKPQDGTIVKNCGFLEEYLKREDPFSGLQRLFDTEDKYKKQIPNLLELRRKHHAIPDSQLRNALSNCIQLLPEDPAACLSDTRNIVDIVLGLIFKEEFGEEQRIPEQYLEEWEEYGKDIEEFRNRSVPGLGRGKKIRFFRFLTASDPDIQTKYAKFFSKNTHTLVQSAHNFSVLGQHPDEEHPVSFSTASAAVSVCVELVISFYNERPTPQHRDA